MAKIHCKICDLHCQQGVEWDQHLKGRKHRKNIANQNGQKQAAAAGSHQNGKEDTHVGSKSKEAKQYCKVCCIWCSTLGNGWNYHINSPTHVKLELVALSVAKGHNGKESESTTIIDPTIQSNVTLQESSGVESKIKGKRYCETCQIWCSTGGKCWTEHINGRAHRNKATALAEQNLASAEQKQSEKDDSITSVKNEVLTSGGDNGSSRTTKDKVQIAVDNTSSGMMTFQQSIGGKSGHDDILSQFEHLSLGENQAADELAMSLFLPKLPTSGGGLVKTKELALFKASTIGSYSGGALFGHLLPSQRDSSAGKVGEGVYLNTHEPFCFVTVGVQGAGKSHTSSCVLESCLVPFKHGNIIKLSKPMTSLVLHYDHNPSSICEAAGLLTPNPTIDSAMGRLKGCGGAAVPKSKAVILVSPTYYAQRKKFYGDYCTVKPLLFRWRSLGADHIKRIMRIESGDNQLYVATFLDLLREYQRQDVLPEFSAFLDQVRKKCSLKGQTGPLDQRIALLESVVAESAKNASLINESLDLTACSKDGYYFVIADLTDPLLAKEEANGLFQVLTEQFRTLPTKGGKVLCLDEAHKYMSGDKADGLSEAIVNVARLMRHDGIRLVVSTQSPRALAPELLELVTVAALHHFHSPDWWSYLKSKLPLHQNAFERILSLGSGEAVAFATSHDLSVDNVEGSHCLPIRVRPRLTADFGSSRKNS